MSVQEDYLQDIAEAIREKTGSEEPIKATGFAEAIRAIPTGMTREEADARYLQLTGGTMTGDIDMGQHMLTGLTDASGYYDAARKYYVDNEIQRNSGGIKWGITLGTSLSVSDTKPDVYEVKVAVPENMNTNAPIAYHIAANLMAKVTANGEGKECYAVVSSSGFLYGVTEDVMAMREQMTGSAFLGGIPVEISRRAGYIYIQIPKTTKIFEAATVEISDVTVATLCLGQ